MFVISLKCVPESWCPITQLAQLFIRILVDLSLFQRHSLNLITLFIDADIGNNGNGHANKSYTYKHKFATICRQGEIFSVNRNS